MITKVIMTKSKEVIIIRAVFMGTPEIAAVILEKIILAGVKVVAVVTQPDKPRGRGKEVSYSATKIVAMKENIPVYQPIKVKEAFFVEIIKEIEPDIILVAAFGQIIPKSILDIPRYGCLNVHASLLPKYRGAAPIQWAIMNGEEKSGVTIMYMNEGLDTGDIILKKELLLDKKETAGTLYDKFSILGADALLEVIEKIKDGTITRTPQEDSMASYAKMLDKEMGNIDFLKTAKEIECLVRGLNPWPSAYTHYQGKLIKLWDVDVCEDFTIAEEQSEVCCGTILFVDKNYIYVKTKEGVLKLCELQLEGKKRMSCSEYLKGNPVLVGSCFHA